MVWILPQIKSLSNNYMCNSVKWSTFLNSKWPQVMPKGYTSVKEKFCLQFWEKKHKRYVLGWSYFWMYNVIHRIRLRANWNHLQWIAFWKGTMELCLWTAWGKKICILEIIYKVNDMKGVSHPSSPPQWECIQIVCVCLYYTKWKFLLSQRQSSASWLVLSFYNSMKNGYSSYEYRGVKYRILLEVLFTLLTIQNLQRNKIF